MSIDGTWKISMQTPMGTREVTLEAKAEGGVLAGTWTGPQGSTEIEGGTVEGDSAAWRVKLNTPMGEMTLTFEGVVNGDELSGTVQTPRGQNEFTGKRA